jgi:hypothetical protein
MQIDYEYTLTEEQALLIKLALKFKCDIEIVNLTIDYKIYGKHHPQTQWEPEEFPELEVVELEVNYLAGEDGVPIEVHTKDKIIILDVLQGVDFEEICWKDANERTLRDTIWVKHPIGTVSEFTKIT